MLTIQKNDIKEEIALLLKFGKKEHLESLRKGNISVNNIDVYVKQELESGIKGIGDKHDGATLISGLKLTSIGMHNNEDSNNNIINDLLNYIVRNKYESTISIHKNEDKQTPIFCAFGIRKSELENKDGKLIFKFAEDEIKKLKDDFEEYTDVFIVTAGIFAQKILEEASKKNISVEMDQVKYYDEKFNQLRRIKDSESSDIIFWKKECFSNQREFRIAFPGTFIDERTDLLNIGSLEDISLILSKDVVLKEDFELEFIERTL